MALPAALLAPGRLAAAEILELRFDGLELPVRLDLLEDWSRRRRGAEAGDLAVWLNLLQPDDRRDLRRLLLAPLLRDRSFGRQLLDSWAGGQMLDELGDLLTTADGASTTALLQTTLRRLLQDQREVTAITLLRALPSPALSLRLDGLLDLAQQWRRQLERQQRSLALLRRLPLRRTVVAPALAAEATAAVPPSRSLSLRVAHRPEPLPLQLWPAADGARRPWLLLMPGLGGTADQLAWLAASLARRGWSVAVLQHPGSDAGALQEALEGQRPPPGAETLPTRLDDVHAVLAAHRAGALPLPGRGVVLMGHSLGALTALLAAGLEPEPGLERRCSSAIRRLPIANPSRLLQCQLPSIALPTPAPRSAELRGLLLFNGFGNQLWPGAGLRALPLPVLMVGGSLDLVTPPLEEQLDLFLPLGDRRSRLVIVDGGSHFSPVRVSAREKVLFRLGSDLVGVEPEAVQTALLQVSLDFLRSIEVDGPPLRSQRLRSPGGLTTYVLDGPAASGWQQLRSGSVGRAAPPADPPPR
jgi:hypothetical protein